MEGGGSTKNIVVGVGKKEFMFSGKNLNTIEGSKTLIDSNPKLVIRDGSVAIAVFQEWSYWHTGDKDETDALKVHSTR